MKIEGYTPRAEFVCPFCGGQASAGFMVSPDGISQDPTATHTFPYCEKFEKLEANEYFHVCAVKLRKAKVNKPRRVPMTFAEFEFWKACKLPADK